jgi:G3E family GTPase
MEKKILLERERGNQSALGAQALSLLFSPLSLGRKTSTLNQLSFLGKTTVLRHLLQNSSHLRIGCVVNDVADVNIDAKLVRNDRSRQRNKNNGNDGEEKEGGNGKKNNTTADLADTIELANGCACCSIQDELFGSFEQLLSLADAKGATYDR